MSHDPLMFLRDMHDACMAVGEYAHDLTFEESADRGMADDAIVRRLEIIGEAAKSIPDEVRARHREVEWVRIGRTPDILAHHYFSLEDETLWELVQVHVPALATQLEAIIDSEQA